MATVVSFIGYMPPPRFDGVPWVSVKVEESATREGPWTAIAQLALEEDVDPSEPAARNLTTDQGTLEEGWYRLIFYDAGGGFSEASDPVSGSDEAQTFLPDAIRNRSPLLRAKYPIPPVDQFKAVELEALVGEALALVSAVTWRVIDPAVGCLAPEGESCSALPSGLQPIALRAVTLLAERLTVQSSAAVAENIANGRLLRSITGGPWSETYVYPTELGAKSQATTGPLMDPDQAIGSALWMLATEAARDYWVGRASGVNAPAGAVSTFDYRRQNVGYRAGTRGGVLRSLYPDGW